MFYHNLSVEAEIVGISKHAYIFDKGIKLVNHLENSH